MRLVDCTEMRLRGMNGVVQGWEQESGRIRVQVGSEVVHVWPGELLRIQEQEGQSSGERKRCTLDGPDTASSRAEDEVKRADHMEKTDRRRRLYREGQRERNLTNSVTSEGFRGISHRGVGRRGVVAGVASGLKVALKGIWKWAISRTNGGTPWGAKRKRDKRGEG